MSEIQRLELEMDLDGISANHPQIKVRDAEDLKAKLQVLVEGGAEKLQILSDFDWTITKWKHEGKSCPSSHGVMEESDIMPQSFIKKVTDIFNHYYPIEIDPRLSDEEKIPIMEEWWTKTRAALLETNITKKMITEMTANTPLRLREGFPSVAKELEAKRIPLLIFSAGIGDIVLEVLKHKKLFLRNQTIISNQIEWDDGGKIKGYKNAIIHSFNKNEALKRHLGYFENQRDRCNAILMGDSIGDLRMVQVEERLVSYLEKYDVVLIEDETMKVPQQILDAILK